MFCVENRTQMMTKQEDFLKFGVVIRMVIIGIIFVRFGDLAVGRGGEEVEIVKLI